MGGKRDKKKKKDPEKRAIQRAAKEAKADKKAIKRLAKEEARERGAVREDDDDDDDDGGGGGGVEESVGATTIDKNNNKDNGKQSLHTSKTRTRTRTKSEKKTTRNQEKEEEKEEKELDIDSILASYTLGSRRSNNDRTVPEVEILGDEAAAAVAAAGGGGGGGNVPWPSPPRANFSLTVVPGGGSASGGGSGGTTATASGAGSGGGGGGGELVMFGGEYYDGVENVVFDELFRWDPDNKTRRTDDSDGERNEYDHDHDHDHDHDDQKDGDSDTRGAGERKTTTNTSGVLAELHRVASETAKAAAAAAAATKGQGGDSDQGSRSSPSSSSSSSSDDDDDDDDEKDDNKDDDKRSDRRRGRSHRVDTSRCGTWKRILSPPPTPPARCSHAAAHYNRGIYIFGGELATADRYHHYRDFWKFDLRTNRWEEVEVRGTDRPSPRSGHRMLVWRHHLVLFGGFYESLRDARWYDDLWTFDFRTSRWTEWPYGRLSSRPPARSAFDFGLCSSGDVAFVYGGFSKLKNPMHGTKAETKVHVDGWMLHLANISSGRASPTWERCNVKRGEYPSIRSSTGCVPTYKNNTMLIFGGVHDVEEEHHAVRSVFYDDLFAFDMERRRWFRMGLKKKKTKSAMGGRGGGGRRRKKEKGGHDKEKDNGGSDNDEEEGEEDDDGNGSGNASDEDEATHPEGEAQSSGWDLDMLRSNMFAFIDGDGNIVYEKIDEDDEEDEDEDEDVGEGESKGGKEDEARGKDDVHDEEKKKGSKGGTDDEDVESRDNGGREEDGGGGGGYEADREGCDKKEEKIKASIPGKSAGKAKGGEVEGGSGSGSKNGGGGNNPKAEPAPDEEEKPRNDRENDSAAVEKSTGGEPSPVGLYHHHHQQQQEKEEKDQERKQRDRPKQPKQLRRPDRHSRSHSHSHSRIHRPNDTLPPSAFDRTTPLPRINPALAVRGNVLYVLGGLLEIGDREVTLDDCWTLDLNKRERWECVWEGSMHRQVWRGVQSDEEGSYVSTGMDDDDDDNDNDDGDDDDDDDDDDGMGGGNGVIRGGEGKVVGDRESATEAKKDGKSGRRRGVRDEIAALRERHGLDDADRTPLPGEAVSDFYGRTSRYWEVRAAESIAASAVAAVSGGGAGGECREVEAAAATAAAASLLGEVGGNEDGKARPCEQQPASVTTTPTLRSATSNLDDMSSKEIKREGFLLARARYDELRPVLERLAELVAQQDEGEGGGGKSSGGGSDKKKKKKKDTDKDKDKDGKKKEKKEKRKERRK